jgi:hypothetical protein
MRSAIKTVGGVVVRRVGIMKTKGIALLLANRWIEEMGGMFLVEDNNQREWEVWVSNFYE